MVESGWTGPWAAPAKLNLFLHITGRRADGYHELETVFQLIDRCDWIWLKPRSDGLLRLHGAPAGLHDQDNLCLRAARALRAAAGRPELGADIRLDKRLPIGAGLGGGSSDAATVLRVLDRLWGLDLGVEALAQIGLRLGADVPLFVHGRSAWGEGLGERLSPITLPERHYLVVTPPLALSTARMFAAPDLKRDCAPITMAGFLAGVAVGNVFEPVAMAAEPALRAARDWLLAHAGEARLTGSGASWFAALPDAATAVALAASVPKPLEAFAARGLGISPLLDAASLEPVTASLGCRQAG